MTVLKLSVNLALHLWHDDVVKIAKEASLLGENIV